jgi:hypothetical protein
MAFLTLISISSYPKKVCAMCCIVYFSFDLLDGSYTLHTTDADAQKWDERWEWTEMTENGHYSSTSQYVNLVKNPERFTGTYSIISTSSPYH